MKKLGKFVLYFFGVIIVLGIVGSIVGGGEEAADSTPSNDPVTETNTEVKSEKAPEKKEEKPETKAYAIGEMVEVGNLGYKVLNVKSTNEIKSDNQFIESAKTNGQFVIIEIEAFNNDTEARMVDSNMFKVKDGQGREFDPTNDVDISMLIESSMDFFLQDINPGLSKTGTLVFELPADATSYTLQVSSGFGWAGGEYADIKLK